MWKAITRFFRKVFNMTQIPVAPNLNSRMRKFRFVITNNGQDGQMRMNEAPQIGMAPNPQYLINLYAASGDKIRILEELPPDGETRNYGKVDIAAQAAGVAGAQNWAGGGSLGAGTMLNGAVPDEQLKALEAMHGNSPKPTPPQEQAPQAPAQAPAQPAPAKSEPTFFKIGSIECKMENGKVYQKQWMRVSEADMANYRIISDKNNKILPMTGKHLEVLKWAISEEES